MMKAKWGMQPPPSIKLRPPVSLSDFSDTASEFIEALRSLKKRPFVQPYGQGPRKKTALSLKDVPWLFSMADGFDHVLAHLTT